MPYTLKRKLTKQNGETFWMMTEMTGTGFSNVELTEEEFAIKLAYHAAIGSAESRAINIIDENNLEMVWEFSTLENMNLYLFKSRDREIPQVNAYFTLMSTKRTENNWPTYSVTTTKYDSDGNVIE